MDGGRNKVWWQLCVCHRAGYLGAWGGGSPAPVCPVWQRVSPHWALASPKFVLDPCQPYPALPTEIDLIVMFNRLTKSIHLLIRNLSENHNKALMFEKLGRRNDANLAAHYLFNSHPLPDSKWDPPLNKTLRMRVSHTVPRDKCTVCIVATPLSPVCYTKKEGKVYLNINAPSWRPREMKSLLGLMGLFPLHIKSPSFIVVLNLMNTFVLVPDTLFNAKQGNNS